jgi:secreted trypsin-like serine protease
MLNICNVRTMSESASLIDKDWIVTAAHCVDFNVIGQDALNYKIVINDYRLNITENHEVVRRPAEIISHPNWSSVDFRNDIALIRLDSSVTNIDPVEVLNDLGKNYLNVGAILSIIGWGRLSGDGVLPNTLQEATNLKLNEDSVCKDLSPSWYNEDKMICVGRSETNTNTLITACNGDSGGPSFSKFNGKHILTGITSFGKRGCTNLAVYTDANAYRAWMEDAANITLQAGSSNWLVVLSLLIFGLFKNFFLRKEV